MIKGDGSDKMRNYMSASEGYSNNFGFDKDVILEDAVDNNYGDGVSPIQADLFALIQRLRMFNESSGGDYALGFEAGMQRAAEMIENVIDENFGDR